MKHFFNLKCICAAAVIICSVAPAPAGKKACLLTIINSQAKKIFVKVEIADTEALRSKGLMDRQEMPGGRGMLFTFDREQKLNFWMKNTYIPLSIAYINKDGVINEIYDMKPLDISVTYPSDMPATYALEVNRGWFEKNNITRGCRIILHGCIGK